MRASSNGHEVVVEALLKAGATVDMQDEVLLYWTIIGCYFLTHAPNACSSQLLITHSTEICTLEMRTCSLKLAVLHVQ